MNGRASDLLSPGTILRVIMEQYDISEEYICKNAIISKETLYDILIGEKLIPCSIAVVVENICKLEPEFWARINDDYSRRCNLKYSGQGHCYRSLLYTIAFEKDIDDDNNL